MVRAGLTVTLGMVFALGLSAGCEKWRNKEKSSAQKSTLYARLGGEKAIRAVVDDFVPRAASDPKVNFTRKGIPGEEWDASEKNVKHLKDELVMFISQVSGGPQKYKGKDMKAAHKGMKITNAEFDAIAADLQASLQKLNVPAKESGELMAIVGTTRKDMVEQ